eukprot:CAMPEP_0177227070 /NCGR_PEP_ID=MMETSP0367-20130122/40428_1 /TAXON_ID=447022 ORGANISM="Scrippsiella hangoei-like, Strain SHHI-4" /NCGR_SAMPLE_ID=MMETSP0367 /ASSEMBLY_ACC=CAM_ASM_000362 /LENGTH=466 /DNA_ID=CAMNT_0018677295 /DNA_START=39 /DNA_END=1435 /DNA_ORIENTATION=+
MAALAVERNITGGGEMPDWFACDLSSCRVLQDVSAEIVTTCRSLGAQLQGACGKAREQLPSTEADAEACLRFLAAFGVLSSALIYVAGDLESTVTQPLQKTIATLSEESNGRLKHWQMVRFRFSELQERYGRSRQRSLEARDKLAHSTSGGSLFNFKGSKSTTKAAASEQHAAMCDLAKCEEELLRSEASLRELEDESRKRLQQLEQEKRALLTRALAKGAGSLRRLLPLADKVPPPEEFVALPPPDEWQGVLPRSGSPMDSTADEEEVEALVNAVDVATAEVASQAAAAAAAQPAGLAEENLSIDISAEDANPMPLTSLAAIGAEAVKSTERRKEEEARADPSAKYLQGSETLGLEMAELAEVGDSAEGSEPEDAAVRANNWSPQVKRSVTGTQRKSLVFSSSGPLHLLKAESPAASSPAPSASSTGGPRGGGQPRLSPCSSPLALGSPASEAAATAQRTAAAAA